MISRRAIHDAIRRQAPLTDLSDSPVTSRGRTTDSGETAFFELQLTDIDVKLYNQQYPELNMKDIVSVKSDLNAGSDFYIWRGYNETGDVSETDDYDDDVQEVEVVGAQAAAQAITGIRGSFGISIMDIRRAQMAGVPIEAQKALAARKRMEQKLDKMMAIGSANRAANSIYGFFNNPGLTSVNSAYDVSVAPNGDGSFNVGASGAASTWFSASTGVDWSMSKATGKSPNQVVKDLNNIYNTSRVNSKYISRLNTLTLDERTFDLFTQTPANIGDVFLSNTENYMGYIKRNCSWLKNVRSTIQANYANGSLTSAGQAGVGTAMAIVHEDSPEHGEFLLPQPFEVFPPQLRGMKFSTSMHMRVGGYIIRRPERFVQVLKPQGTVSY